MKELLEEGRRRRKIDGKDGEDVDEERLRSKKRKGRGELIVPTLTLETYGTVAGLIDL
jgi:hypothetical protein